MKINNNLPNRKKISQDEEDKFKSKLLNKSKPIGKKSVKKKLKTDGKEILCSESESLEVLLSQINFEESSAVDVNVKKLKKPFAKLTLETIDEESLEDLEKHYEQERLERESIESEESTDSTEDLEDSSDTDDFISPFTDEELNKLQMTFINEKNISGASSESSNVSENKSPIYSPYSCSFEEFEVRSVTTPQFSLREPQSKQIKEAVEKEIIKYLENKPDFPVIDVESKVELEKKPSSANISISEIQSDFSLASIEPVPSMKLIDYIALKQSLSLGDNLGKNEIQTSKLSSDLRSTFRSLYDLICRFLESPHLIYIVVFMGSTYITLSCVFRDSIYVSELVWNIFPTLNTPFSSAAFEK